VVDPLWSSDPLMLVTNPLRSRTLQVAESPFGSAASGIRASYRSSASRTPLRDGKGRRGGTATPSPSPLRISKRVQDRSKGAGRDVTTATSLTDNLLKDVPGP
jgi:hypothetical protein